MASPLMEIPQELIGYILWHLQNPFRSWDIQCWSSTCSYFRTILSPWIFADIYLTDSNYPRMQAILDGEGAKYVKYICVQPNVTPHLSDYSKSGIAKAYPEGLSRVLSSLDKLPNLESLAISLHLNSYFLRTDLTPETPNEIRQAEATVVWRVFMAKTFDSMARNKHLRLKQLTIHDFILVELSSFTMPGWHHFLSKLEGFELRLPFNYNRAGYKTYKNYEMFASRWDTLFFDHLKNATRFIISAPEPLMNYALISLRSGHLPNLRHLNISHTYISQNILDILIQQAPIIESIILRNVMAHSNDFHGASEPMSWPPAILWSNVLGAIADADPLNLVLFDIRPHEKPERWHWRFHGHYHEVKESPEHFREVMRAIEHDPDKMVFLYGRYHGHDCRDGGSIEHFHRGDDQRAYQRVMGIVRRNQARMERVAGHRWTTEIES